MPALVGRALRFVPAAMLTAIVVPPVLLRGRGGDPALANAKLIAALVAAGRLAQPQRHGHDRHRHGHPWLAQWLLRAAA